MKKIIFFLTAAFFCLLAGGQETLAAAETVVAELDTDRQECIFEIRWEEEEAQAQIRITSPGGEVYGTEETPDSVTAMQGCAYFYIGEAQAGDWQVEITGEKLGEVEVNVGSLPQSMQILSFTVAENGRGGYDASWNISDCPENAEIAVYADTDNRGYDGQLIASGGSGPEGTLSFQMASLDSGYYYFYLTVTETGGIFNYQYGDTALFYDNTGGRNKLENTEASLLNRDVYVSWKGEENRTYRVMLFDPDTKLLLTSRETEETSCVLPMPEGYDRILAAAADYISQTDSDSTHYLNVSILKSSDGKNYLFNFSLIYNEYFYGDETITFSASRISGSPLAPIFPNITVNSADVTVGASDYVDLKDKYVYKSFSRYSWTLDESCLISHPEWGL